MATNRILGSRYELIERIATGGMGEIFLARDTALSRRVVIKRLLPRLARSPNFVKMFRDEARAVAAVDHPNIVRIYDVGHSDGHHFFSMEWLVGWDLLAVLTANREQHTSLPLPVTLRVIHDLARGLHAAHLARGEDGQPLNLIHRDISPQNLFVTREGVAKLLDFGVAKSSVQRHRTAHDFFLGKPSYMSPEQILGRTVDARSDIFSLGIVLHEMLTNAPLFLRNTPSEILSAVTEEPIPPPYGVDCPTPERLLRLVNRALSRNPSTRFVNAGEMAEEVGLIMPEIDSVAEYEDVARHLASLLDETGKEDTEVDLGRFPNHTTAHVLWPGIHGNATVQPLTSGVIVNDDPDGDNSQESFPTEPPGPGQTVPIVEEKSDQYWSVELVEPKPGPKNAGQNNHAHRTVRRALFGLALLLVGVIGGGLVATRYQGPADPPPPQTDRPTPPSVTPPKPDSTEKPPAPTKKTRHKRSSSSPMKTSPARTGVKGRLTLQAEPWADVYLNGKRIGQTPLIDFPAPAGRIRIRLVNPTLGTALDRIIVVPPDRAVRHSFDLRPKAD